MLTRKVPRRKRLTVRQVEEIRAAEGRQVDIAIRFGVTQAQVSRIKGRQRRGKVK